jgi:hypothetical protein
MIMHNSPLRCNQRVAFFQLFLCRKIITKRYCKMCKNSQSFERGKIDSMLCNRTITWSVSPSAPWTLSVT